MSSIHMPPPAVPTPPRSQKIVVSTSHPSLASTIRTVPEPVPPSPTTKQAPPATPPAFRASGYSSGVPSSVPRPAANSPYTATGSPYASRNPTTPARRTEGGHRVSRSVGCFPVTPNSVEGRRLKLESPSKEAIREPTLPANPSIWTPSELAQYLAYALRTGGSDGQGPTLPAPVVEDVISWVLRSRVTGSQFVKGVEEGVSRPPPFLPVLSTLSRRLRRRNGRRSSDALSEADINTLDDRPGEQVTRVRKLAHAFEIISSASEASGDEGPSLSALRAQVTGESLRGFGRATPKTEQRGWSRRDSLASATSEASASSSVPGAGVSHWRQRVESGSSLASAGSWDCASPGSPAAPESPSAALRTKAEAKQLKDERRVSSPPPPYDTHAASPRPGLLFPTEPSSPKDESKRSGSITPLQDPVQESSTSSPDDALAAHLHRMVAHRAAGIDPYAVLRRDGPRRPGLAVESDDEPHWTSTRRVTVRPEGTLAVPGKQRTPSSGTPRRRREREMEREVAGLTERIRELEERLIGLAEDKASSQAAVPSTIPSTLPSPTPTLPSTPPSAPTPSDTPKEAALVPRRGWLASLGLANKDGVEPPLRELPAVLFLLGVGVGAGLSAVLVRLLLVRKNT